MALLTPSLKLTIYFSNRHLNSKHDLYTPQHSKDSTKPPFHGDYVRNSIYKWNAQDVSERVLWCVSFQQWSAFFWAHFLRMWREHKYQKVPQNRTHTSPRLAGKKGGADERLSQLHRSVLSLRSHAAVNGELTSYPQYGDDTCVLTTECLYLPFTTTHFGDKTQKLFYWTEHKKPVTMSSSLYQKSVHTWEYTAKMSQHKWYKLK